MTLSPTLTPTLSPLSRERETYTDFIQAKAVAAPEWGYDIDRSEVNPLLKPHQRDIVCWAVKRGRAALFESFGLGKTVQQLEIVRLLLAKLMPLDPYGSYRALIVCPLGVRQEFVHDAAMLGMEPPEYITTTEDAEPCGIYLTKYERERDGDVDPTSFDVVSLDEAGILRGFGGTKTFRTFMDQFEGSNTFRFVATATPSPNEFVELLSYAAFLGVMDVGQAKTRFFKRDPQNADKLTIHPHKEREFWLWVASWAIFVQRPSDLGYSDEGYELPPLDVRWHEVPSDHSDAGIASGNQRRLLANASLGVVEASREKRNSLGARIAKMLEVRAEDPAAHRIIWHDQEAEREAIEDVIPDVASVYGKLDDASKLRNILAFANGEVQELAAKPVMLGSGVNFQRHCSWAVFLGIGFKFNDFIQAIHRLQRFQQPHQVRIDLIYTEAEREVKDVLVGKWRRHEELVANMTGIIREFGLAESAKASALSRTMGVEREEATGAGWTLVRNDCVAETASMPAASVDLVLTSIPFSTQYEYSPAYEDFGHTDDAAHFWRQMDFLTPELFRVLKPGRCCVIHIKDRIAPGGFTGLGFQTVQPFHADAIKHYIGHGFAYLGMQTITTDVVRENNQTYRLGWTEQCKDGSRMGVGMPEYLLRFRRPPSDSSDGYADVPIVKEKADYTRARWQTDASGYMRSSGERLLTPSEIRGLSHRDIYRMWKRHSTEEVYDYERHVELAEALEEEKWLPVTFQLFPPHSWHPGVWSDVTRMRTLNGQQYSKGKEMHLCPMQFDVADRVIRQMSMPGEVVYDPFSGLGTVALRAVKLGRQGIGCELAKGYHEDAVFWLRQEEAKAAMPTLFDLDPSPLSPLPMGEGDFVGAVS